MRNIFHFASVIAFFLVGLAPPDARAQQSTVTVGSGGTPFTAFWHVRGNGPRDGAIDTPSAVSIQADKIVITPRYQDGQFYTGSATTDGNLVIKSGSVEGLAQICTKAAFRSAIWLQSPQNNDKGGQMGPGAEIDIAEIITSAVNPIVMHNVHRGGYGSLHWTTGKIVPLPNPCQTHSYKSEFGPFGYRFYVDNRLNYETAEKPKDPGADEYLIFGTEFRPDISRTVTPGQNVELGQIVLTQIKVAGELSLKPAPH